MLQHEPAAAQGRDTHQAGQLLPFPDCSSRRWGLGRAGLLRLRRQRSEVGCRSGLYLHSEALERGPCKVGSPETREGLSGGFALAGLGAQTETLKGLWEGGWHSGRAGRERPHMLSVLLRCQQTHIVGVRTTP